MTLGQLNKCNREEWRVVAAGGVTAGDQASGQLGDVGGKRLFTFTQLLKNSIFLLFLFFASLMIW